MSAPHDPFALKFDAIDLDPTRAPTRDAIDRAMAYLAPQDEETLTPSAAAPEITAPGFYLVDDCGGRFSVDRDMGVVTLTDESLLTREQGAVFSVRLRVVEQSGASYDMDLSLRLTGRVPQVVGSEDILSAFGGARGATPTSPVAAWATHAVLHGAGPLAAVQEAAPFGAAIERPALPTANGPFRLHLYTPLPPIAPKTAIWSL